MSVVLTILGILGKILLILLAVVLVLLLLVLFFPFTYRGTIHKQEEEYWIRGKAGWLFHALHVNGEVKNATSPDVDVRVFGISLLPLLRGKKEKKETRAARKAQEQGRSIRKQAAIRPSIEPGERKAPAMEVTVIAKKYPSLGERMSARLRAWLGRIRKKCKALREMLRKAIQWKEYLQSPSFSRAYEAIRKDGFPILRHVLPRRMHGDVCFGFDDPAKTGETLAILGMIYPVLPEKLRIEPDFLESRMDADLDVRGHILLAVPAFRAIRMWANKDVRRLVRRLQKTTKTKETRKESWQRTENTPNFRTM